MRTFYLKTRAVSFNTKNSFKEHLKLIRQRAEQNKDGIIQSTSDISDLKDFIQDYCDKSEHIQELFDLDNCSFLVKKSPNHSNKCLFIINNHTNNEEQISTTNFGNPPTPLQNFRSFCTNTITEHKKTIREKLTNEQGKPFDEMDLWHKNPTTKEIVDEFIQLKKRGCTR